MALGKRCSLVTIPFATRAPFVVTMAGMRFVACAVLALALGFGFAVGARAAEVKSIVLPSAEDRWLPFWCHWGYDWYERCYREHSDRLELGGAEDKVWRSALRFSVRALPPEAMVITAELSLRYDATCVAPRRGFRACDGRAYDL